MNIIIDSFNDTIRLYRAGTKKIPELDFSMSFDFGLTTKENQAKALVEILKTDEGAELSKEKNVSLLIGDEAIGFGLFEIPVMSHTRQRDIFDTRFKSWFPNFEDYFVLPFEYERAQRGSKYLYSFCKKESVDLLINIAKNAEVKIDRVDFFASKYADTFEKKGTYPIATLIIGKWDSELIISKGSSILAVTTIGYGENLLNNGEEYLHSAYFRGDNLAAKFASFAKENFASRLPYTDEAIHKADPSKGISFNLPKELRLLRGDSLHHYNVRNNYRKYVALLTDIIATYSSAPWFLPLSEIKTIASDEVYSLLKDAERDERGIEFVGCDHDLDVIYKGQIGQNKLFASSVKTGKRRFQWSKFFSMEIGKKKKP